MSSRSPRIRNACVVFIDIIGFKALAACPKGSYSKPRAALEWLEGLGRDQIAYHPHYYFRLSDSAVYVVPFERRSKLTILRAAFLWAKRAQEQALKMELLLRGGLTCGPIYCDPDRNMVFGPALHRAYSLESTRAVVPRIVVDRENVPRDWLRGNKLPELGDGLPFIDCLGVTYRDEAGVPGVIGNLKLHAAAVRRLVSTMRSPQSLAMCNYLVAYHNEMIASLTRFTDRLSPSKAAEFRSEAERLRIPGFDVVPALLLAGLT